MNTPVLGAIGTLICWLYAAAWAAIWWWSDAPPPVLTVIEPIVGQRTHSVIPVGMAGLILFGCAPFVREADWIKRVLHAIAIAALIAPGVWQALTTRVTIGDIVMWLGIPLAIALWTLGGGKTLFWRAETTD